jgi:hypothetical protein
MQKIKLYYELRWSIFLLTVFSIGVLLDHRGYPQHVSHVQEIEQIPLSKSRHSIVVDPLDLRLAHVQEVLERADPILGGVVVHRVP